ncbi:hypothetical protein R2601_02833 [Salipiger bermudensis HTCC2601]|uniref:Uncharacterized protein n=1 Tax=Salipiger bermudensis (strain DSM 26914 / JCM 13377 / KCTC 12554 / HTCC2601) TaxID=314265 RepID=Q0FWS9_SALBH|nr:hypothetical protein R2601_02833 [Salipiger bermudensis HTCC2601]
MGGHARGRGPIHQGKRLWDPLTASAPTPR